MKPAMPMRAEIIVVVASTATMAVTSESGGDPAIPHICAIAVRGTCNISGQLEWVTYPSYTINEKRQVLTIISNTIELFKTVKC